MVGPAPPKAMNPPLNFSPAHRVAGVLAPVFAVRSDNDLGCGDTHSLCEFIDWVADLGFGLVQVLPINETGGDHSPYNAISSMALDITTLWLHPASLPELLAANFEEILTNTDVARLSGPAVDYVTG